MYGIGTSSKLGGPCFLLRWFCLKKTTTSFNCSRYQDKKIRGGLSYIQGYSVEYPNFLARKFTDIAYMCICIGKKKTMKINKHPMKNNCISFLIPLYDYIFDVCCRLVMWNYWYLSLINFKLCSNSKNIWKLA